MSLKIYSISSEVAPFAKTGGLADVAGALPKVLHEMGHDVRVVMPSYAPIEHSYHTDNQWGLEADPTPILVPFGAEMVRAGVLRGKIPGSEVPIYFVGEWSMFTREKIYGYSDDAHRFAFFSRAALELLRILARTHNWRPDIVHAHDWHAAPAVAWLDTAGRVDDQLHSIPTVFTIHNLMHQGRTSWDVFDALGLQTHSLAEEHYGEVNFMARGIYHATMINTVSPTYAREIMTPKDGAGMDTLLQYRHFDIHGILNGVDYAVWDPATDPHLARPFSVDKLADKAHNKRELQKRAGLPLRNDVPLVAMVSRLDWQKGLDITGHIIHLLMNTTAGEAQFIVLGTGDAEYETMFERLAEYHSERMVAFMEYDAMLAQLMYGGSDIFLMPSRFEPCGLGQLIAMRYGSVPVVRATGGLADTVKDGVTGFTFYDYSTDAFWRALAQAMKTYYDDQPLWQEIQRNGMNADFSWERSAKNYVHLYQWAISRMRGW